jgi:hypothetical protein
VGTAVGSNLGTAIGTIAGTNSAPINPKLQILSNYGGPTRTMALLPSSPAVDRGQNDYVVYPEDQRGFPRIRDGNGDGISVVDMGAYELLRGDLDGNGAVQAADIDLLYLSFGNSDFDLTRDGITNQLDVDELVRGILRTQYGDANLDGRVDGLDYLIWNANKFTAGGWAKGDFNGDRLVDASDYIIWNQYKWWPYGLREVEDPELTISVI